MKELPLTRGMVTIIDDEDYDLVSQFQWNARATRPGIYYAARSSQLHGKEYSIYLHRFLLPNAQRVDHINGNRLDNRRENLRACTNAQNIQNQKIRTDNASGYKGVRFRRTASRWYARIETNGTVTHLGGFSTPEAAARAYDAAAIEQHGTFARLNFPP